MLRKFSFLIVFLFHSLLSNGQGQFNNWFWSLGQRITFNTNPPTVIPTAASITSFGYTSAVISSPTGVLLFYTDGKVIKDAAHNTMPNGTLTGGTNIPVSYSTGKQSALIVPDPGNSNCYYLFLIIYYNVAGTVFKELRYCKIDMTLNGGMGDVISTSKNVFIAYDMDGQVTAVKQTGSNNFWIIAHSNTTNTFNAFLLTAAGISSTPVTTSIGPSNSNPNNYYYWGCIKANPQGTKVARINPYYYTGNYNNDTTELYDFNASLGTFSNYQLLTSGLVNNYNGGWWNSGLEFSMNGSLLYRTHNQFYTNTTLDTIIQYNLANNNAMTFIPVVSPSYNSWGIFDMQLAPNGKIYLINDSITNNSISTMSVIDQPNVVGLGCNYIYAAQQIVSNNSYCYACPFPNIVPSLLGSFAPSLDSQYANNVLYTTATIHARVSWDGNSPITQRGFYYGTSPLPLTNTTLVAGTTGSYLANLTGLIPNTLYYYRAFATNANGTTIFYDSTFHTLPIPNTPPVIKNLHNKATCVTDTMRFVVVDAQTTPANMQVSFTTNNPTLIPLANIAISGADTNKVITFTPVPFQSGVCTITITALDTNGSSVSQTFTVTVAAGTPLTITAPNGTTTCAGGSVLFACAIPTGASIDWSINNTASGISTNTYTTNQAISIKAICTNAAGCKSNSNTLQAVINPKPTVSATASGPTTICIGTTVALQAQAIAGYTYQWFKNNVAIAGATNASLSASTTGVYKYVATLNGCTDTSNAITVTVKEKPSVIITTPNTTVICNGQGALLQANPSTGYSYQWQMNGFDIPGATNSTYSATIGSYYNVIISNGTCTNTSPPISISVNSLPVTIIQWNGTQLYTPFIFASYQWYVSGVMIPGATQQYYTPTTNGVYYCRVGNENNCYNLSPNYNLLTLSVNNLATPSLSLYPNPTTGIVNVDFFTDGVLYVYNAMGQLVLQQSNPSIDLSKQANGMYLIRAYNSAQELIGIGRVVKE
jgi:hypothetical protein